MRRVVSVLVAATLLFAVAGCSSTPSGDGDATAPVDAAEVTCPAASQQLSTLEIVDDPRTVEGGSTACLPSQAIAAVDDSTAPALPVTVTDDEGREVTVTDVSRILAIDISGTIAATVFGLGLGDALVGRDTSTDFTGTEDLPVVTKSGHTLNAEAILELAPTVVITDTTIGPKEVRQQLRDAGIAVVVISSEHRIDTVAPLVHQVAEALGVPSRGEALAERIETEIEAARTEVASALPSDTDARPRMLFLYVRGTANVYYIFGEDSGADSLIEAVGGVDVAGEIGWVGQKPMTAEALIAAQPDVLVMMTDGLESVGGIDGLIERVPAIAETPAGANRRVVDMADAQVLSFGPRTPEIIRAIARAVYAPSSSPATAPAS